MLHIQIFFEIIFLTFCSLLVSDLSDVERRLKRLKKDVKSSASTEECSVDALMSPASAMLKSSAAIPSKPTLDASVLPQPTQPMTTQNTFAIASDEPVDPGVLFQRCDTSDLRKFINNALEVSYDIGDLLRCTVSGKKSNFVAGVPAECIPVRDKLDEVKLQRIKGK